MSSAPKRIVYVPHSSTDVYWNFGLESYFVENPLPNAAVVLFWRTTPTLMLGKYQNLLSEVNLEVAEKEGVQLVRRKSGGGTIFTDLGGWQFSFIQAQDDESIDFAGFIKPVLAVLHELGIPAEFSGRNDILVHGKKFSGNAQYRTKGMVVHHGSILFDSDVETMLRCTTVSEIKLISKGIESIRERVINLRDCLPGGRESMDSSGFGEYMGKHLPRQYAQSGVAGEVEVYALSEAEKEQIQELGERYYKAKEELWGRNPAFTLEEEKRFAGGSVRLLLKVDKGIIEDAQVQGDFFANLEDDEFAEILKGVPYQREAVHAALEKAGIEEKIYRISAVDLASLIRIH